MAARKKPAAKKATASKPAASAKVRVVMRVSSWSSKPGDVLEVDAETAAHLIREGHATAE